MITRIVSRNAWRGLSRFYSDGPGQSKSSGTQSTSSASGVNDNVPGLSSAVIQASTAPVGPGVDPNKSGAYKVPEYFCYDQMSFFEAEVEMAKYRLPQPSALRK